MFMYLCIFFISDINPDISVGGKFKKLPRLYDFLTRLQKISRNGLSTWVVLKKAKVVLIRDINDLEHIIYYKYVFIFASLAFIILKRFIFTL